MKRHIWHDKWWMWRHMAFSSDDDDDNVSRMLSLWRKALVKRTKGPFIWNIYGHNRDVKLLAWRLDIRLLPCIQEDEAILDYFYNPPVHPVLLRFNEAQVEVEYRKHKTRDSCRADVRTLDSPRLNSALDVAISFAVFLFIAISCFILFRDDDEVRWRFWLV